MPSFLMKDANSMNTRVASERDEIEQSIKKLLEDVHENDDTVIGFDAECWFTETYNGVCDKIIKKGIVLLTLCTRSTCVLINFARLQRYYVVETLNALTMFLANKDIIFVGVLKKDDLEKLRNDYGLQFRNVVDLSELAVRVLGHPSLSAYGTRKLASYLDVLHTEPRTFELALTRWDSDLTDDQMECATIDAYASYKIGKRLLEVQKTRK